MGKQHDGYQVVPFPRSRLLVVDALRMGHRRYTIHGMLEVDITEARRRIRAYRARTGEPLSLTAFLIACLGQAVDADRLLHAYRTQGSRLILFDEVDVTTIIEVELEGRRFPLAHILRATNRRTCYDIQREISGVQRDPSTSPSFGRASLMAWFLQLPTFARDICYRVVRRHPHLLKQSIGTVLVTAVGMFGAGGGWGIGIHNHTLALTLGGVARKPGVVGNEIAIREYLSMTISVDHEVVDGAPAARFVRRLKSLIESSHGLGTPAAGAGEL